MFNFYLFSIIKNGQLSKKKTIFINNTFLNKCILNFLWDNGYILCYIIRNIKIKVYLKYVNSIPVIEKIKVFPKSKKIILSIKQLYKLKSNKFFLIFTNFGLQSLHECKYKKIGGLLIAVIN